MAGGSAKGRVAPGREAGGHPSPRSRAGPVRPYSGASRADGAYAYNVGKMATQIGMQRQVTLPAVAVMALLLVAAALALLLNGRFGGETRLQQPTASVVDPAVLEALQRDGFADVYISLKDSTDPATNQSVPSMQQYTANIQDDVLSILTPSDFTLTYRFPLTPALTGRLTASGLKKLADDPDVELIQIPPLGHLLTYLQSGLKHSWREELA